VNGLPLLIDFVQRLGKFIAVTLVVFGVVFLVAPLVMTVYVAFLPSLLSLVPKEGYTARWFVTVVNQPGFASAGFVSVTIAALATGFSLLIGILAGYAITRFKFTGKESLITLSISPLTIPAVVTGTSLLFLFTLIRFYDNYTNLLIAHIIITLPYAIRSLMVGFLSVDASIEDAAANMGANRVQILSKILLPLLKPAILASVIFGISMSIDDIGVSVFLVGPSTSTLSVLFLTMTRGSSTEPILSALATILLAVAILASILSDRIVGFDKIIRSLKY
jgi:putative spermidine/putrescine transport system permease protein